MYLWLNPQTTCSGHQAKFPIILFTTEATTNARQAHCTKVRTAEEETGEEVYRFMFEQRRNEEGKGEGMGSTGILLRSHMDQRLVKLKMLQLKSKKGEGTR